MGAVEQRGVARAVFAPVSAVLFDATFAPDRGTTLHAQYDLGSKFTLSVGHNRFSGADAGGTPYAIDVMNRRYATDLTAYARPFDRLGLELSGSEDARVTGTTQTLHLSPSVQARGVTMQPYLRLVRSIGPQHAGIFDARRLGARASVLPSALFAAIPGVSNAMDIVFTPGGLLQLGVEGDRRIERTSASIYRSLHAGTAGLFTFEWDRMLRRRVFSAQMQLDAGPWRTTALASRSEKGVTGHVLTQGSVAWPTDRAVPYLLRESVVGTSVLMGRVYVDVNDNGREDSTDTGIPGVGVSASGRQVATDSLGWYRIAPVQTNLPLVVELDSATVVDPAIAAFYRRAKVTPEPMRAARVDFPFTDGATVEGDVLGQTGAAGVPLGGVRVVAERIRPDTTQHTPDAGRASPRLAETTTFDDGAYLLAGLMPGRYLLRVTDKDAARGGWRGAERIVELGRVKGGANVTGQTLVLSLITPRDVVASAPTSIAPTAVAPAVPSVRVARAWPDTVSRTGVAACPGCALPSPPPVATLCTAHTSAGEGHTCGAPVPARRVTAGRAAPKRLRAVPGAAAHLSLFAPIQLFRDGADREVPWYSNVLRLTDRPVLRAATQGDPLAQARARWCLERCRAPWDCAVALQEVAARASTSLDMLHAFSGAELSGTPSRPVRLVP